MSAVLGFLHRAFVILALPVVLFVLWYVTSDSSTSFYFPPLRTILGKFH